MNLSLLKSTSGLNCLVGQVCRDFFRNLMALKVMSSIALVRIFPELSAYCTTVGLRHISLKGLRKTGFTIGGKRLFDVSLQETIY